MFLQRAPRTTAVLQELGLHLDTGVAIYEFTQFNVVGASRTTSPLLQDAYGNGASMNLPVLLCGTHNKNVQHNTTHIAAVFAASGYVTSAQTDLVVPLGTPKNQYSVLSYATHRHEHAHMNACEHMHASTRDMPKRTHARMGHPHMQG